MKNVKKMKTPSKMSKNHQKCCKTGKKKSKMSKNHEKY